jgi:hypothetical protein
MVNMDRAEMVRMDLLLAKKQATKKQQKQVPISTQKYGHTMKFRSKNKTTSGAGHSDGRSKW